MSEEICLSARGIAFTWSGGQPVLDGISLEIARGQTLAILGPNGAGKTTLLSILSGRLSPRAGAVELDGRPFALYSARERARHIAFLPQLEKLAFNYRVLDFVLMGRTPHMEPLALPGPEDRAAAEAALASLGMTSFETRNIGELSGGEFQLVRLARCLAQGAPILILDEPVSMLDPAHARHIADALLTLAKAGKTILYSTHDIGLAMFLGGQALILANARVQWSGPTIDLHNTEMLSQAYGISFLLKELPSAY